MKTGIDALAARCGVAKGTVSRVLNQRGYVSAAVRDKVLKAARELNYFPKQTIARESIAIVTDSGGASFNTHGFGAFLAASLAHRLNQRGYQAVFIEINNIAAIHQNAIRAAIIISGNGNNEKLKELKIPLLCVNDRTDFCHSVCTDHAGGVNMAVRHLADNGHQHIGLLLDNTEGWAGRERLRGYAEGIRAASLPCRREYIAAATDYPLVEAVALLLRQGVSALIACGESLGLQLCYALNLLGKNIPHDISVISSEKPDISGWLLPPHTTINQNFSRLVEEILDVAECSIRGEFRQPEHRMLESSLVVRQSVKNLNLSL